MSITLSIDSAEKFNLSLQQNYVPIINGIQLDNGDELDYENIELKISSEPPELISGTVTISLIRATELRRVENPRVRYSWTFLESLQERIRGIVIVEACNVEGKVLASTHEEILVEPKNVWLGQAAPLELLCAYIQPNVEAIQPIIRRAGELLNESTGDSAINAYQTNNRSRVYLIAQAIYLALREKNITYARAPASFERLGQKIRTHTSLIDGGVGNCLDIALLYAACLEQAGINSLVFLVEGHAFSGFWLENKFLPRSLEEDAQFFRKRIELDEIVALDVVGVSSEQSFSFKELVKEAKSMFDAEEKFEVAVDVKHCRELNKIHPINDRQDFDLPNDQREDRELDLSIESKNFEDFEMPDDAIPRSSEVEKWKDKLLDLSFRNRLLNFKEYRSTVRILCEKPSQIEDWLADGSKFELLPEPNGEGILTNREDAEEVLAKQIQGHFERKELLTGLRKEKFSGVLTGLFRSAVNAEEETGANTLFLSLGVLAWTESEHSSLERKSPLLLLPVYLKRKSVGGKFHLSQRGDDTVLNATLLQKLKKEFGLEFPGLDPLPVDESGVDVDKIFNIIKRVIKDRRGWEVREEVWLSEFSFQKFLMWKELDEHYEKMLESYVVKRIMTSEKAENGQSFVREHEVEELAQPDKTFCPLSSDSSQMAAILSAARGKSFVLQGPPGTGKSQTIANMISHLIGVGKKVLFVSEKKVALEVVYKRLKEIGIGQFCLELHSKKSEKKEVIKSFLESLEYRAPLVGEQWAKSSSQLATSRTDLNQYFSFLHQKGESGISAYSAFVNAARTSTFPKIDFKIEGFVDYPNGQIIDLETALQKWKSQTSDLSDEQFAAWSKVGLTEWSSDIEDKVTNLLDNSIHMLGELDARVNALPFYLKLHSGWDFDRLKSLQHLCNLLLDLPQLASLFLEVDNVETCFNEAVEAYEVLCKQSERKNKLLATFDKSILSNSLFVLHKQALEAAQATLIIGWWKRYKINKELKPYCRKTSITTSELVKLLEIGRDYQDSDEEERQAMITYENFIGAKFSQDKSKRFHETIAWARDLMGTLSSLYAGDLDDLNTSKKEVSHLLKNRTYFSQQSGSVEGSLSQFIDHLSLLFEHIENLDGSLETREPLQDKVISDIPELLKPLRKFISNLRDVVSLNVLRNEVSNQGLNALFEALDQGKYQRHDIMEVFIFNFHRQFLNQRLQSEEKLNNITGNQLNVWDKSFKEADENYMGFTKKALVAKVSEAKPELGDMVIPDTPVGLIVKEGKKSRGHMSIRKFLNEIDPVAKSLKP